MPDIELPAPEIDDIDEEADRFKKIVAIVVVSITFFAAIIGFLQTSASNKEEVEARDSQIAAVTGFGTQIDADARYSAAYDVYAEDRLVERRSLIAHARARLVGDEPERDALNRETVRYASVREALAGLSPLLSDKRYSEDSDPAFPNRFFADAIVESDKAKLQQMARAELVNAYGGKADAYVAVLTVLAVALFLVGLSLTVAGRGRRLLFIPGVGLAAWCVLWSGVITARQVSETPVRAINAVAEGNRLLSQQDYEGAIASYTSALDARPDYGIAFAGRSDAHFLQGSPQRGEDFVSITAPESLEASIEDAERAIEHGEGSSLDVVGSLGFNYFLAEQYEDAARLTDQAIELNDEVPELLFNRGVIALALEDEDTADEAYDEALGLVEDLPYEYVRSDLFRAARTDLEILATNLPEARDAVTAMQERIVAFESGLRSGDEASDGDGVRGARIEDLELGVQGNALNAFYDFEGIPSGTEIAHVWYRRPDRSTPFSEPRFMSSFEFQDEEEEEGERSLAALPGGCAIDAEYRLDVFVAGKKAASATFQVDPPELGDLVEQKDDAVGVTFCRPKDWERQESDDPALAQFASADGNLAVGLGAFSLPAEVLEDGPEAAVDSLIGVAASGFSAGRVTAPIVDFSFAGFEGRALRLGSAQGSVLVAGAVGEDDVVRLVLLGASDDDGVTQLEAEFLPTVFFDVGEG